MRHTRPSAFLHKLFPQLAAEMTEETIDQNGTDDVQDKKSKKVAKHDGGVADLERVTDYAEEKELSSADISNVSNRF